MNRRELTGWMLATGLISSAPTGAFAALSKPETGATIVKPSRSIMLKSIHTGEAGEFKYLIDGEWIKPELARLFTLLRDHRTGDVHPIDGDLLEQLFILQQKHGKDTAFNVISGFRSAKTNAMLSGRSSGVAKKSQHMLGKAIDINLPGVALGDLHATAREMKAGGVGRYSKSGFIHLDTGRVRYWGS